jgi:hypothetical protein
MFMNFNLNVNPFEKELMSWLGVKAQFSNIIENFAKYYFTYLQIISCLINSNTLKRHSLHISSIL